MWKMSEKETIDNKLKKNGWSRQFTTCEPRLSEAVELYKSLGFEVHLEPMKPDERSEECKSCLYQFDCDKYKTIYIRPKTQKNKS
jgi:hypothetical protein